MQTEIKEIRHTLNGLKFMAIMQAVILLVFAVLSFIRPNGQTVNQGGAGGNADVENTIIVPDAKEQILKRAQERGHFTATEYAQYSGTSLETVYRHAQSGQIAGAYKDGSQWCIPLPQSSQ